MKKNLFYSFSNIIINTLYPLVVFPYISRILSVSAVGTYNYYSILFSYIVLFSSFGVSLYASKEIGKYKNDILKRSQILTELLTLSIFNALLTIILVAFPVVYFAQESDKLIAIIFSIMIVSNSISVEWYYIAIENQRFIFFRNMFFKTISLFLIFYLIKTDDDLIVYVLIVVLSLLLNALINFVNVLTEVKTYFIKLNFQHYKGLIVIFLIEITFRYYGMGDIAILEKFVTRRELGFFTFSLSIFNIISSFLKIIATTLLPRVSFMIHNNEYSEFYVLLKKTMSLIFFISFPAMLFLFFASDSLVLFFGGDKYLESSNMIKSFCPLILISSVINTIVFQILYPLGKTKLIIITYVLSIVINIVLNLILIPEIFSYALIVSSITSNIFVFVMILLISKHENIELNKLFTNDITKYFISFCVSFLLIYILSRFKIDDYNILAIVVGLLMYLLIIFIAKDSFLYKQINRKILHK